MSQRLFKKALSTFVLLVLLTLSCFALTQFQPGNPYIDRLNPNMPPELFEKQLIELGYYDSLPVKYGKWVTQLIKLDFGYSIKKNTPIGPLMLGRIKNTVELMGIGYLLTLLIGIPLGILMSTIKNKTLYNQIDHFNQLLLALPSFFVGILLIKWFSADLNWFPASGMYSLDLPSNASSFTLFIDKLKHMALPLFTLLLIQAPLMVRFTCNQMEQIYSQPFIKVLQAKGVAQRHIVWKHCFKNIWVPLLGLISTQFPIILSGALITEGLFQYPGMGLLAYESSMSRDYPVIMALLIVNGICVIVVNFIAEALYPLIDPRIQTGEDHA